MFNFSATRPIKNTLKYDDTARYLFLEGLEGLL